MANRYWVGGTNQWNSTSTAYWSATSGGAGGASVPTAADSVFFDQPGTYTVSLGGTVGLNCLDITVSAGTVTFDTGGSSPSFTIAGNMSLIAGTVWTAINSITFNPTAATIKTITTNGTVLNANVTNGNAGTLALGSALTIGSNRSFNLNSGTLDLNGFTLTTTFFDSTTANTRSIAFGSSNIVIANNTNGTSGGSLNVTTGTTFSCTGTGGFTAPANLSGTFACSTLVAGAPNLTFTGTGTAAQTLSGTFGNLDFGTTAFNPGTTSLTLRGLALSAGGTFTNLTPTITGTGILNGRGNTTLPAITINSVANTTTLTGAFSLTPTGTFTFTSGTLNLNGFDLTTGVFTAPSSAARSITFGSNNIKLATTTAGQTNLSMGSAANFTCTGTGGFTATADITRTFSFATATWPSVDNAPNLTFTGTGSAVQTITDTSYFRTVDFGTTAFDPGTTSIYVKNIILSSSGTYTGLLPIMNSAGTILSRGKSIRGLTINAANTDVITLLDDLTVSGVSAATTTLTNGTLDLNGFTLTTAQFSSTTSQVRSIIFGSSNIIVQSSGTYSANMLDMANITNFTWTGTGKFVLAMSGGGVRTLNIGTSSGATLSNAPNVSFISSTETATLNIEPGSWFNTLDFTNSTNTPTMSTAVDGFYVSTLVLSSTGTYTNLVPMFTRTQTWTAQYSKQFRGLGVGYAGITLTLDGTQTYVAGSDFFLTAGTLNLGGYDLTIETFNSSNSNTRAVAFGSNNIILNNLTAGRTNLSIANATGFTCTGTGGFRAAANITRTFSFGSTAGGTSTNAPNLTFTGSGTAVQTLTNNSWFNKLDFGTTAFSVGLVGSYVNTIVLSSGCTYTGYTATMVGTGSITGNGALIGGVTIDVGVGNTCSLSSALNVGSTLLLITGTLDLNGYDITASSLQSSGTTDRAIAFGSNNITLQSAIAGSNALNFPQALGFTRTGTGGLRAPATPARVFTFGSTQGGTSANALSLTFTGSGTAIQTLTTSSWFNTLDFGTTAFDVGSTVLNVSTLTLSSGGTFTGLRPSFTRTQTWTPQFSKQLGGIGVNGSGVTLTLDGTQTYTATSIFTLTEGTLNLGGFDLTIGTFVSSFSTTRSIAFGSNNIILATTTVGATNLSMANTTNFTWTGTGGFRAAADITRTFTFGTTGGTSINAPNLTFIGSDTAAQTLSSGSWFNKLDFGTTQFAVPSTNLNLNSLALNSTGTFTALTATMVGTGTISNANTSASQGNLAALTINCPGGTTTLASALISNGAITLTTGTLALNNFNLTTNNIFSSSNTNTRAIAFGSASIVLNTATAAQTVLSMANATGFTWTGTGGFTTEAPVTRTFTFGTTGGSSTNAPNVTITGTNTSTITYTSGSWFNNLSIAGAATVPTTTLNLGSLSIGQNNTGTPLANMSINLVGSGGISWNGLNTTLTVAAVTLNTTSSSNILLGGFTCTTYTQTAGNSLLYGITCTGAATINGGTLGFYDSSSYSTLSSTTFTINGATVTANGSSITCNSATLTTGTLNLNGGYFVNTTTFTHTNGTVTLGSSTSGLSGTTYNFNGGTINLNGYMLSVGAFSSSNTNTRSIAWGTGGITLSHGTTGTTVLNMAIITGYSYTGTQNFYSDALNNRTFVYGTTGGTSTNAPNLTLASGTFAGGYTLTFTAGSWFNILNFGTDGSATGTGGVNVNTLTLSPNGSYTGLAVTGSGTGTITPNGKTIAAFTINSTGTTTLAAALSCTTYTQTAGTINFATFNLTCSGTATYTAGTLNNIGTITCTTWTCAGTFTLTQGTITPSTSFVVTGGFNYNGGTLSAVPTFTHTSGTVTLGKSYALTATGTYTLTAGTLDLGGYTLTTGIFSSSNANTRSISFGTNNIVLIHTTAATTVLAMAITTGFTWTGTGGFTAAADVARTYQFGSTTAGGWEPNLTFTGSGTAIQTLTTSSWFKTLDFGTTAFNPGTTALNLNSLTLSTGGTFTGLSATMFRQGTITPNGKTIAALTINVTISATPTTTLAGALSLVATGTTTLTTGTLDLAGYTLTTGTFTSNNTNTRSISFGTGSIVLATTTAGSTVINVPDATGFTYTGIGGFTTGMSVTRTFYFGSTAGGSASNAPNLALTSGASVPTFTANSWFKKLDFTGSTCTPGTTTIYVDTLILATGGTYSSVTPIFTRTQTWTAQFAKQLNGIGVNIPAGTLTLDSTQTYTATSTCYVMQGTLSLGGTNQTFGILNSNNTNTRSIAFGSNNIALAHTTAATTVLNIPDATNFTCTGTGGFTSAMSVTRTFTVGTTGGSINSAPNLALTSGASVPTITSGSWFKALNFTGTTSTIPTAIVNVDTLTLATGGTYTGLTPLFTRTQTWTPQFSKQLAGIGVNAPEVTLTLEATQTYAANSTLYVNAGTLNLNSTAQTFANFVSTGTGTRSITGGGSITISNNWTVSSGSGFTGSDYTIYMANSAAKTFAGGGGAYGTIIQKTPSTLTITGSNTFADMQISSSITASPTTLTFEAGSTTTLDKFSVTGANSSSKVTLNSSSPGTQFYLRKPTGTAKGNYLTIQDSNALAAFFAKLGFTNLGNNKGWNFGEPATVQSNFASFF
jgi:hypothetical protein